MNKQEAIDQLEYLKRVLEKGSKDSYNNGFINALKYTLNVVKQLKEQEKHKVPQFVADWYEENKDDLEYNLYKLCIDFREQKLRADLHGWFNDDNNKSIETLVLINKFGYEVEKEKLYTVEIPNPNSIGGKLVLFKQQSTGRLILQMLNSDINKPKYLHLTESEIKQDFEWAFQFAKEAEE